MVFLAIVAPEDPEFALIQCSRMILNLRRT